MNILSPDTTLYSGPPYSFSAVRSNGLEPFIKTFATLLVCDGGVLTIGGTRYRIQAGGLLNEQPANSVDHAEAAAASDPAVTSMKEFFDQEVAELKLDGEDHMRVKRMGWFDVKVPLIYWRQCYSYILRSTIAFFERVHEDFVTATDDQVQKDSTMILTGVQGTGKSILGAIIGLFMAKVFDW